MTKLQHLTIKNHSKQPSYESINNALLPLSTMNNTMSTVQVGSSGQYKGELLPKPLMHTKTVQVLKEQHEDEKEDNIDRLEVPKLKPSPTIRISKEWMDEDMDS